MTETANSMKDIIARADQGDAAACAQAGVFHWVGGAEGTFTVAKDEEKAITYFTRGMKAGNKDCQYYLAQTHLYGAKKDVKKGMEMMDDVARKGHLWTWHEMGLFFLRGEFVKQNHIQAFLYLRAYSEKALESDRVDLFRDARSGAMLYYPIMQALGLGCERDTELAGVQLERLAERGLKQAKDALRRGIIDDPVFVKDIFYRQGSPPVPLPKGAALHLSMLFPKRVIPPADGGKEAPPVRRKPPPRPDHALSDADKARARRRDNAQITGITPAEAKELAMKGNTAGMLALGLHYMNAQGLRKNDKEAFKWFKMGADRGHISCLFYAAMYFINGVERVQQPDLKTGAQLLGVVAEAGDPAYEMGARMMAGSVLMLLGDFSAACKHFSIAADSGHVTGEYYYGLSLLLGMGTDKDPAEGLVRLEAAAAMGSKDAQKVLDTKKVYDGRFVIAADIKDFVKTPQDAFAYYDVAQLIASIPAVAATAQKQEEQKAEAVAQQPAVASKMMSSKMMGSSIAAAPAPAAKSSIAAGTKGPPKPPAPTFETTLKKLDRLIGMVGAKQDIKGFVNRHKLDQLRRMRGLREWGAPRHLLMTGKPGTGRTTGARILGELMASAGLLPRGHTVVVTGAELLAPGKAAQKYAEAAGGVLFIDEAQGIFGPSPAEGAAAIAQLVVAIQDNEGKCITIAAGTPDDMKKFAVITPVLETRYRERIYFEPFTPDDLADIFIKLAQDNNYAVAHGCRKTLLQIIEKNADKDERNFGHAPWIKQIFDETLERMANRVAGKENITREDAATITPADIEPAAGVAA
ncbi:MAG: AAA family ATPase [Alphaproteobacteria bacterium]